MRCLVLVPDGVGALEVGEFHALAHGFLKFKTGRQLLFCDNETLRLYTGPGEQTGNNRDEEPKFRFHNRFSAQSSYRNHIGTSGAWLELDALRRAGPKN